MRLYKVLSASVLKKCHSVYKISITFKVSLIIFVWIEYKCCQTTTTTRKMGGTFQQLIPKGVLIFCQRWTIATFKKVVIYPLNNERSFRTVYIYGFLYGFLRYSILSGYEIHPGTGTIIWRSVLYKLVNII